MVQGNLKKAGLFLTSIYYIKEIGFKLLNYQKKSFIKRCTVGFQQFWNRKTPSNFIQLYASQMFYSLWVVISFSNQFYPQKRFSIILGFEAEFPKWITWALLTVVESINGPTTGSDQEQLCFKSFFIFGNQDNQSEWIKITAKQDNAKIW